MAASTKSYIKYELSGTARNQFPFDFPYFNVSDITVELPPDYTGTYTINASTSTVELSYPISVGTVLIRRHTPQAVKHIFANMMRFNFKAVDEDFKQCLYWFQEALDSIDFLSASAIATRIDEVEAEAAGLVAAEAAARNTAISNERVAWQQGDTSLAQQLTTTLAASTGASLIGFLQSGNGAVLRTMQDKARESASISDRGAITNGGSIDTPLQLAVTDAAANRLPFVSLPPGTYDYSSVENKTGVRVSGGQLIEKPSKSNPDGWRLANSYADLYNWELGREYLFAMHNQISSLLGAKGYIYGDSTSFGYASTSPYTPHEVMMAVGLYCGLAFCNITNLGVSGSKSYEWDPSAALADADASFLVVSYGINDAGESPAGDAIESFYDHMDAKLSAVRAVRDVGSLTIILKASNSVNEWTTGRHQVWGERLNGVYRSLARKYQCYFFDTFALYNDSTTAGNWMDVNTSAGMTAHIHPTNFGNIWIWGALTEAIIGKRLSQRLSNGFVNVSSTHQRRSSSDGPDSYPYGVSIYRTASSGWPVDGIVITHKSPDGVSMQQAIAYGSSSPMVVTRNSTGLSSWSAFTGVVADISAGLVNGWTNYDSVFFRPASLTVDADGQVSLSGLIKPGVMDAGTTIINIPTQYRPAKSLVFDLGVDSGKLMVAIDANGNLNISVSSGSPGFVSLNSIRYLPA